jgi:hypothetical protein
MAPAASANDTDRGGRKRSRRPSTCILASGLRRPRRCPRLTSASVGPVRGSLPTLQQSKTFVTDGGRPDCIPLHPCGYGTANLKSTIVHRFALLLFCPLSDLPGYPLSILRYPNEMNLEIVLAMTVQPATTHRLLVANATSKRFPF